MEKLYYTISEVAAMFALAPSTLRFWEKEVRQLQPTTRRTHRYYTQADIDIIRRCLFLRDQNVPVKDWSKRLSMDTRVLDKQQAALDALRSIREDLIVLKNLI